MNDTFPAHCSQVAPGTPLNLAVSNSGLVTYDAPNDDGGALIASFTITVLKGGETFATFTAVEPNLLSQQLTGLTPGQPYTVSVVANNAAGLSSPGSATAAYTPPLTLVRSGGMRCKSAGCVRTLNARAQQCVGVLAQHYEHPEVNSPSPE